jgi:uncharacterized protein YcaQ
MRARPPQSISLDEARRIALAAQGFDRPRPKRVTIGQVREAVRRVAALQLDFVNVLAPAHHLVIFSRVGAWDTRFLDTLVNERREFTEQTAHEASLVAMEMWPLLRERMATMDRRSRSLTAFTARHAQYVADALEVVRGRGPLCASDLPEPDDTPTIIGNWGWTRSKGALEAHYYAGRLAVARRRADMSREYDLAERLIPLEHRREVSNDDAVRELVRIAARAVGVGTVADIADYFRLPARRVRSQVDTLVHDGELSEVAVEGMRERAYLHRDSGRATPARIDRASLLSPFDPLVWYRPRTRWMFDFDYVIEIYVPAAKRRWGYYVLPFLHEERLVARLDVRADRPARRLAVAAAYRERHARAADIAEPLAEELRALAGWLDLDEIVVERRGDLARALASAARNV